MEGSRCCATLVRRARYAPLHHAHKPLTLHTATTHNSQDKFLHVKVQSVRKRTNKPRIVRERLAQVIEAGALRPPAPAPRAARRFCPEEEKEEEEEEEEEEKEEEEEEVQEEISCCLRLRNTSHVHRSLRTALSVSQVNPWEEQDG